MAKTEEQTIASLVDALARRDRLALDAILDGGVRLRALLPSRSVDLIGRSEVASEMLRWFADVPQVVPIQSLSERVGDLWNVSFRFALRGVDPERAVLQHAVCAVEGGVITGIRLLCSGFRPAPVELIEVHPKWPSLALRPA